MKFARLLYLPALCLLLSSCANPTESGKSPRAITLAPEDLGEEILLTGETEPGLTLTLTVREYRGNQVGFWGAETTPPHNVVSRCTLAERSTHFEIPPRFLNDLANVVSNPRERSITDINSVARRVWTETHPHHYRLNLRGGDGAWSYLATIEIPRPLGSSTQIRRVVAYNNEP